MYKISIFLKYLLSFIIAVTQFFTRWAWKEEDTFFKTFLKVKQLNANPDGTVNAELVMSKDDALVICHAVACVFNADTNFTEVQFQLSAEYIKGSKRDETLVIHIFREKGITPAVLLKAARQERDELQIQLDLIHAHESITH